MRIVVSGIVARVASVFESELIGLAFFLADEFREHHLEV